MTQRTFEIDMKNFTKKPINRFLIIFFSVLGAYYVLVMFSFFTALLSDFAGIGARIASSAINTLGGNANHFGNYIISNGNSMQVGIGCDGSEPIILLIAAILGIKSSINSKVSGILIGSSILFVLNQIRILGLFYFNISYPEYFDLMHNDIFPLVTVVASGGLFILWLKGIKSK